MRLGETPLQSQSRRGRRPPSARCRGRCDTVHSTP